MSDFLATMSESSLHRARRLREGDIDGLRARATAAPPPVPVEFESPGFDVIAEAKLASPSQGRLVAGGTDRVALLTRQYRDAGAAAVSVLTEETRFGGSLEHLAAAAAATHLPVMRKDFLVHPIQIVETRAAGASGVLLIARILPEDLLIEMTDLALAYGLFVLVEVFGRSDLETAFGVFDRDVLVGVNCRDLSSLEVIPDRFEHLAPHLPDHLPAVAQSGIASSLDVARVAGLGYRLALVGTSLVSSEDPATTLSGFLEAGRMTLTGARR